VTLRCISGDNELNTLKTCANTNVDRPSCLMHTVYLNSFSFSGTSLRNTFQIYVLRWYKHSLLKAGYVGVLPCLF